MVNEATTGDDGTCILNDVNGEITITVSKEGYETKEISVKVTEDTTVTIELEEVDDSDLEDTFRNVKFNVKDSEDEKVSGASITLEKTDDSSTIFVSSNGGTGPRGGATVRDVSYGTYNVTVAKDEIETTFILNVDTALSVSGESASVSSTSSSETVIVTLTA